MTFEMPKPTAHHQKLTKLAGQWTGVEKMFPSDWDPKGGTATGRQSARVSLDGFPLLLHYDQ